MVELDLGQAQTRGEARTTGGYDDCPQMWMVGTVDRLRLVVSQAKSVPGHVYVEDRGRGLLLAAASGNRADLSREALASARGDTVVNGITTANERRGRRGSRRPREDGQA